MSIISITGSNPSQLQQTTASSFPIGIMPKNQQTVKKIGAKLVGVALTVACTAIALFYLLKSAKQTDSANSETNSDKDITPIEIKPEAQPISWSNSTAAILSQSEKCSEPVENKVVVLLSDKPEERPMEMPTKSNDVVLLIDQPKVAPKQIESSPVASLPPYETVPVSLNKTIEFLNQLPEAATRTDFHYNHIIGEWEKRENPNHYDINRLKDLREPVIVHPGKVTNAEHHFLKVAFGPSRPYFDRWAEVKGVWHDGILYEVQAGKITVAQNKVFVFWSYNSYGQGTHGSSWQPIPIKKDPDQYTMIDLSHIKKADGTPLTSEEFIKRFEEQRVWRYPHSNIPEFDQFADWPMQMGSIEISLEP